MSSIRRIALVSTTVPKRRKKKKGGSGGNIGGGSGGPLIQAIYTLPPEPSMYENSAEDTYICAIDTAPLGIQFVLSSNAGGRVKLDGRDLVVGPTRTDYEVTPQIYFEVQAGVGVNAVVTRFKITIINVEDGPPGSDPLLDENGNFIFDEDDNYIWE